jgi:hypothetical protein
LPFSLEPYLLLWLVFSVAPLHRSLISPPLHGIPQSIAPPCPCFPLPPPPLPSPMPTSLRRSSLASAPRRRHPTAPILHLAISNNPEHVDEMTTAGWQPTPLRAVSGGTAQPVQVLLQIDGHRDQAANSMSCCKCSAWKPTLLRAASAVASSGYPAVLRKQAGVTPSRVRSCSASRPALLRAKSGVAPSRGRRCYKGQPTLLQRPADLATMARRRC